MGTFHPDRGDLHGVTVLVETRGQQSWVGRCDTETDAGIVLRDADVFQDLLGAEAGGAARAAWILRALQVGVWPRHVRVLVPAAEITSVRRLADLGRSGPGVRREA